MLLSLSEGGSASKVIGGFSDSWAVRLRASVPCWLLKLPLVLGHVLDFLQGTYNMAVGFLKDSKQESSPR